MPVDIKSILAAAEPRPIIDPQVMSLARIAQANRTYREAKSLREKQEYSAFAIAQGQEIAGSVTFMDNIADIDIVIGELSDLAQSNRDNKLVQASLFTLRGGLENTKELAEGRNVAVQSLSDLQSKVRNISDDTSKGALFNETNVIDLINNARNFVNTNTHFMDTKLRADHQKEIDKLSKTVNVYNMYEFYDTNLKTPGIDFETKPESAKYLSGMQQSILQQSKNYADAGLIDPAAATLAQLPRVGVAESKIYASTAERQRVTQQIDEYGSSIADINQETKVVSGMLGEGVEADLERVLPSGMKEKLGGILVPLPPSPQKLAGPGGQRTIETTMRQASEMLGIILGEATENIWSPEILDNIVIEPAEANYLNMGEGSNLRDVYDAYNLVVTDEEKEPYINILAHYMSEPKHAAGITRAFKSGDVWWDFFKGTPEEKNAVKLMSSVARTYNKLFNLRTEHYGQFPISSAYDAYFQSQGYNQQSTEMNW